MSTRDQGPDADTLHARLRTLLADLPAATAVQQVGTALAKEGLAASGKQDITALERVLQKTRTLHEMLGTGMVGLRIGRPSRLTERSADEIATQSTTPTRIHRTASGPGLPGWGRTGAHKRVTYAGPREAPPPVYPWGPQPPVPAPRPDNALQLTRPGTRHLAQHAALSRYLNALDDADRCANGRWVCTGPDDVGGWIRDVE